MAKRVRDSTKVRKYEETRKQKVKDWKTNAIDKGTRDSTRVSRLSCEQLQYLYDRASDYVDVNGCYISTGEAATSGYPRGVSLEYCEVDEWSNVEFHKSLLFPRSHIVMAYHGLFARTPTDDCSHLCNTPMCTRKEHLCWESRIANLSRINCPIMMECNHCGEETDACVHEPKCISQ